jgi:hypothetical protein
MGNELSQWGRYIRIGVSGLVFVALLVGGGAAALSALAAGLNALSGGGNAIAQQVASSPTVTQPQTAHTQKAQTQKAQTSDASSAAVTHRPVPSQSSGELTASGESTQSTSSDSGLTSPIGDAIDSGGVIIGNHVQSAFGHVLSHVLDVLFMEQQTSSSGGSQP